MNPSLIERIHNGWKQNSLRAFAGRITLVRSVLQAMPIYILSCGWVPKRCAPPQTGKGMQSLHMGERRCKPRGMSLIAWEKLCKPRSQGNLRRLEPFHFMKHSWGNNLLSVTLKTVMFGCSSSKENTNCLSTSVSLALAKDALGLGERFARVRMSSTMESNGL